MGPVSALSSFVTRYFNVEGRSRRSEYGWMLILQFLFFILIMFAIAAIEGTANGFAADSLSPVSKMLASAISLIWLGSIIPWLTLTIRRFHDMGHTGWLVALFTGLWIIPPIGAIGSIVQFFWLLLGSGTAGNNPYGPDPRFTRSADFF